MPPDWKRAVRMAARLPIAVLAVAAASAEPKTFRTAFLSLELPEDWTCALEETEWVCTPPPDRNGKFAMLVVFTAKEVGADDSPQLYIEHLEERARQEGLKVLVAPSSTLIGRSLWLDATIEGSEQPGYTTRYLGRTAGDLGVLVTFSAHRSAKAVADPISAGIANSVEVDETFARRERRLPRHDE